MSAQEVKERVLNIMKQVEQDAEIPSGLHCLGKIDEVYPELPEEVLACYRTWIYEWYNKSFRVAVHDSGNGHCSYICEGTPEALIENLSPEKLAI